MIFMMWLRWTLPRLRIDQVMATCLKYCVPLASIMLVGAALWTFYFPGGVVSEVFGIQARGERSCGQSRAGPSAVASPTENLSPIMRSTAWTQLRSADPNFFSDREESLMLSTIHWHSFFFLFFALAACGFALAVVFSSNIVRMAFYLILSLGATAGLFFLAGAEFLGAAIDGLRRRHAGAAGLRRHAYCPRTVRLAADRRRTMDFGFAGRRGAAGRAPPGGLRRRRLGRPRGRRRRPPGRAVAILDAAGHGLVGRPHRSPRSGRRRAPDAAGYLLVFEIISIHLLVVLVGAAYLARAKRHVRPDGMQETQCGLGEGDLTQRREGEGAKKKTKC